MKRKDVVPVGLLMPKALLDRIQINAQKLGISKSGYIRYILIKELTKNDNRLQNVEPREPT